MKRFDLIKREFWKTLGSVELRRSKWSQQREKIVEFKRQRGHCLVPFQCKQDVSLGTWVNRQRTFHKNDKLLLD
jgi:hypothetical protein